MQVGFSTHLNKIHSLQGEYTRSTSKAPKGTGRLHDKFLEKKNRIRFAGRSGMICKITNSYPAHHADVSSIIDILFFSMNMTCQEILHVIALEGALNVCF
jgi:hypothetical protein